MCVDRKSLAALARHVTFRTFGLIASAKPIAAGGTRFDTAEARNCKKTRLFVGPLILIAFLAAITAAGAQPPTREVSFSAGYWRDVCAGQRIGISRVEQETMCRLYLSSFHDAVDEYADAGHKLFCPPDMMSAEAMRRDFLAYMADIAETAEFFPAGRALLQALMRAHPCPSGQ